MSLTICDRSAGGTAAQNPPIEYMLRRFRDSNSPVDQFDLILVLIICDRAGGVRQFSNLLLNIQRGFRCSDPSHCTISTCLCRL